MGAGLREIQITKYLLIALALFSLFNQSFGIAVAAAQHHAGSWEDTFQRGKNALDANEYWIAEPLLKKAMLQAEAFKDERLAKSLAELGRLYTIRGRFDEAQSYLEEELSIRDLISPDRYTCIPTMSSLIQFYLLHGTKDKAMPLTEDMLSLVEGKLNEARAGSTKTKFQKGKPLQGWLGVAAPVMKDPIIEWAIACDAAANCHKINGDRVLANRLYNAALDIKIMVLGNNHLSLANSYDSLGELCLDKKDLQQAESYFADGLKITEKNLSPDNAQVYERLNKLAKCQIEQGKYKDAEALYLHAQTYWKGDSLPNNNEARNLFALGTLYTQEHQYETALPYLQKATQLSEQINGPDSIALVPYLRRYAYTLYYLGRKPDMEQLNARADSIAGPKDKE